MTRAAAFALAVVTLCGCSGITMPPTSPPATPADWGTCEGAAIRFQRHLAALLMEEARRRAPADEFAPIMAPAKERERIEATGQAIAVLCLVGLGYQLAAPEQLGRVHP